MTFIKLKENLQYIVQFGHNIRRLHAIFKLSSSICFEDSYEDILKIDHLIPFKKSRNCKNAENLSKCFSNTSIHSNMVFLASLQKLLPIQCWVFIQFSESPDKQMRQINFQIDWKSKQIVFIYNYINILTSVCCSLERISNVVLH